MCKTSTKSVLFCRAAVGKVPRRSPATRLPARQTGGCSSKAPFCAISASFARPAIPAASFFPTFFHRSRHGQRGGFACPAVGPAPMAVSSAARTVGKSQPYGKVLAHTSILRTGIMPFPRSEPSPERPNIVHMADIWTTTPNRNNAPATRTAMGQMPSPESLGFAWSWRCTRFHRFTAKRIAQPFRTLRVRTPIDQT